MSNQLTPQQSRLKEAFYEGARARSAGGPDKNPYPIPPFGMRIYTEWDAWDSGYRGESWKDFTSSYLWR